MTVDERVKKYFSTEWTFTDFFYAYCNAKGIDDPEEDIDEETYNRLEKECEEKLTYEFLVGLERVVTQDTIDHIYRAMED